MRWERLFDDLEAQVDAEAAAELAAEVAERTRIERSRIELADRLQAAQERSLGLHLRAGLSVRGSVAGSSHEWVLLTAPTAVVPLAAVTSIVGLDRRAGGRRGPARRHSLAAVLRMVSRDRSPVRVDLLDGPALSGTVDAVGADHLDLAVHHLDEPRRTGAVRSACTVPFGAVVLPRPSTGSSSLV